MLKKITLCITALIILKSSIAYSQKKELLVLDYSTKLPIEGVNIFYQDLHEGSFTNSDGKATIHLKDNDLKISHINYTEIIIPNKEQQKLSTILLIPKAIFLDEVIVSSFNLPKAMKYVIANYGKLYENRPFEKECNFKETLTIDGNLKRLIMSKVNWWGKSYKFKHIDDLKLRLGSVDFNKNECLNIFTDSIKDNTPLNTGAIPTKNIVGVLYLNNVLNNFQKYLGGITSVVEQSPSNEIRVSYETQWVKLRNGSEKYSGQIIFDKQTKAITSFSISAEKKGDITKRFTEFSKKPFTVKNTESVSSYTFIKDLNNKWTLNSLELVADASLNHNNKTYKSRVTNSIFILKESPIKKVNNNGLIDLTKPIFESLPSLEIANANSILLNEEEKKFIYDKK